MNSLVNMMMGELRRTGPQLRRMLALTVAAAAVVAIPMALFANRAAATDDRRDAVGVARHYAMAVIGDQRAAACHVLAPAARRTLVDAAVWRGELAARATCEDAIGVLATGFAEARWGIRLAQAQEQLRAARFEAVAAGPSRFRVVPGTPAPAVWAEVEFSVALVDGHWRLTAPPRLP
ncbi:hypothetical protein [Patulibacter defluvii]|uniref:hypothetical protein n=1 Tax=Patulibacter defluvii TaxID=3095358 RepID=UPI002A74E5A5|nr:hypothetical protein [Patulibacter sp. DM4]